MKPYLPDRGDLVWLAFSPHAGHEQGGRRPALTLSAAGFNRNSGLAIFCPVTSQEKGYVFEVPLYDAPIHGVILVDQVKSLDWKARQAAFIAKVSPEIMDEVTGKLLPLVTDPS